MDEHLVTPRAVWTALSENRIQLIDLRGRDERSLPRVPGAREIPLDELASELVTLDRERPVVFLSGTGSKAATAMELLRSAGLTASAVAGGMQAWLECGLPTEDGAAEGA